jgi:hypothetical protein
MGTRFESHIDRRPGDIGAGCFECHDFGVVGSRGDMGTLSNDLALRVDNDRPDPGIGVRSVAAGQFKSPNHVFHRPQASQRRDSRYDDLRSISKDDPI